MAGHSVAPEDNRYPASYRPSKLSLALPSANIEQFLEQDLSVDRLEVVQRYLWLAGLPYRPRPLNLQAVMNRKIIPTTDASLHLVWTSTRMFLKPIPQYMLSDVFYERYLSRTKASDCANRILRPALGFLYSYLALVPTETDFVLAREAHLIPPDFKWAKWRAFTRRVLEDYPTGVIETYLEHGRYEYGELRLSRLNKIYRVLRGELLHGYSALTGHTRYVDFLTENLGTIAAGTVYIVVVLAAMQVGLTTSILSRNSTFQTACYGFAAFAILSPLIALSTLLLVFLFMFIANSGKTLYLRRMRRKEQQPNQGSRSGRV